MRPYVKILDVLGNAVSGLEPLRDASLNSVQRIERVVGWIQRQLTALESALQPRQSVPSPFAFPLTHERLEVIKHLEATAPVWRPEDHPIT